MALTTNLHFSRFEFKYILRAEIRREVEAELAYFFDVDPYLRDKPGSEYVVRSLYFEDEGYTHYYDKIDGQMTRSKFRVRTYTRDASEDCATFLEVKGRHNNLVFKHRVPIGDGSGLRNAHGVSQTISAVLANTDQSPVRDKFRFNLARKQIKPIMLIDYTRRPLINKYDPEFRVTFDSQLSATAAPELFPPRPVPRRTFLRGYTVMEVKLRHHIPAWFHRLIQAYQLRRVSISKICAGIDAFGLTPSR